MTEEPDPNPQAASQLRCRARTESHLAAKCSWPVRPWCCSFCAYSRLQASCAACTPDSALAERTDALAAPTVTVAPAKLGAPVDTFVLPGNVTAYTDSPIYARTDGYLLHWYFDIGAQVKKGDLLAVIDTPELDKQVAQAESDLATAQANANIARIQAERYSGLVKSDAVSQQDTDTFVSQAAATASAVKSAQANLQRLRELQSFEKIYAPFDGVVTARDGRYRPAHQFRLRQRRHGALPHAGPANAARLHQRAADATRKLSSAA